MFFDDFLHIEGQKPIKRRNLLGNQSMLVEVSTNNSPSVFLIYQGNLRVLRHLIEL